MKLSRVRLRAGSALLSAALLAATAAHAHGLPQGTSATAGRAAPDAALRVRHVPAGEGEALWVVGDTYTFKATGAETGGRLFVWEAYVPPLAGPPPHVHTEQHEAYFLLDGELEVLDGETTIQARAGSFVYVPPGTVHAFRNSGNRPARMLVWMTPAGFEGFFREVGQSARAGARAPLLGPEELARTIEAAPRYGMELRIPDAAKAGAKPDQPVRSPSRERRRSHGAGS